LRREDRRTVVELPPLRAISLTTPDEEGSDFVLTPAQRRRLEAIATRLDLQPRALIYRAGTAATYVYVNGAGVVKSVQELPSGRPRITSFWFARDLFGVSRKGKYVYTTLAVTAATVYRMPLDELRAILIADGLLQYQILSKVTHEYREAQRQKLLLIRRDAVGRLAMFLRMLERRSPGPRPDSIAVPMTRSDIASYLGITLEAVSRARSKLESMGILDMSERQLARILDRPRFEKLVARM
jgi:CRP/FNR family transcriptional regulator